MRRTDRPSLPLLGANRQGQVGPSDYKQHRNLVLIFFRSVECRKCRQLLREIAAHYGEYQRMEDEVLVIR
jgi:peroxiredoxin